MSRSSETACSAAALVRFGVGDFYFRWFSEGKTFAERPVRWSEDWFVAQSAFSKTFKKLTITFPAKTVRSRCFHLAISEPSSRLAQLYP